MRLCSIWHWYTETGKAEKNCSGELIEYEAKEIVAQMGRLSDIAFRVFPYLTLKEHHFMFTAT